MSSMIIRIMFLLAAKNKDRNEKANAQPGSLARKLGVIEPGSAYVHPGRIPYLRSTTVSVEA